MNATPTSGVTTIQITLTLLASAFRTACLDTTSSMVEIDLKSPARTEEARVEGRPSAARFVRRRVKRMEPETETPRVQPKERQSMKADVVVAMSWTGEKGGGGVGRRSQDQACREAGG
jgi:hypothetical protein